MKTKHRHVGPSLSRARALAIAATVAAAALAANPGLVSAAPKPCPKLVTVTDAGDDGSPYQLRTAIAAVCNGGKVELSPTLETIVLWGGGIPLDKNVKIAGSGQTVQAFPAPVFTVSTSGTLVLSGVGLSGSSDRPGIRVYGAAALKSVTVTGFWHGIRAEPGSSVTLGRGTVISGNHADRDEGGAGIYNDGGMVTLREDAAVTGNLVYACFRPGPYYPTSGYGGGIFTKGGGAITLEDQAVVSGNEIWHCDQSTWPRFGGSGGGIFSVDGPVVVGGQAQVSDNSAATGGGISAYPLGTITLAENAAVTGNLSSGYGGGISLSGSTLAMYDAASISGNVAGRGGGVNNASGIVTLNGTATITGNTASAFGGGIYNSILGGSFPAPQVILNDFGSVTGNAPDDIYYQ